MKDFEKMTEEELMEIAGGTPQESLRLALALLAKQHGKFFLEEPDPKTDSQLDTDGMAALFASKGYRFEPGTAEKVPNKFYTPDGVLLTQNEMIDLILKGKF